jgi:hypothetical protein
MLFNPSNRVDLAIIKGNSAIPIEVKAKKLELKDSHK